MDVFLIFADPSSSPGPNLVPVLGSGPGPIINLVPALVPVPSYFWSRVSSHSASESESDTQRAFMFIDHINDGENNTRIRTLEQDILHASCNHNQCH